MQRQRSILSFLRRPPPESQSSGEGIQRRIPPEQHQKTSAAAEKPFPEDEVRGTDTPPEKIRQSFFNLAGAPATNVNGKGNCASGSFSSILHKFSRKQDNDVSFSSQPKFEKSNGNLVNKKDEMAVEDHSKANGLLFDDGFNGGDFPQFDIMSDVMGPETPANRPLVPGVKRVQEVCHDAENNRKDSSLLSSSKQLKPIEDLEREVSRDDENNRKGSVLFSSSLRLKPIEDLEREVCCDTQKKRKDSLLFSASKRLKPIESPKAEKCKQGNVSESSISKFEWLNPSSIRDASKRWPGDPLYDKRTLYIPPDAMKKMSASQKQYWSVKCKYMDVILFFKVGKFYELYELDAEIGRKELDWKMTISGVGKCRQVGISEAGIDDAVQKLIARGYKVGRIEQLETSEQAKARGTTSVIERKLVHVSTPSTVIDGNMGPDAVHLLALKEGLYNGTLVYGFAFVDCAALKFWVGSVSDDDSCAALGALLMQISPREVVYESSGISNKTQKALNKYASAGNTAMQLTPVMIEKDLSDASEVRKLLHSKGYFRTSSNSWTSAFDCTLQHDLVVCALGGLVGHLSRLKLDDVLHNGELLPYHVYKSCLRMDGQTLINLEIFSNNVDGGLTGTLYKHLDHCITSSGKRLLRRWICHPLKDINEINDRLNAVEGFITHSGVVSVVNQYLRRLPDIERLLGRVKASVDSTSYLLLPLLGEKILKQRIKAFGSLVKGLKVGTDLLIILQKEDEILSLSKVLNLPVLSELDELLQQFEAAINDDFPQYQDHDVKESDAETLSVLVELFVGKASEWSHIIHVLNYVDVIQAFASTAISSSGSMSRPVLLPADSHSIPLPPDSRGPILQIKGLWHPYAIAENGNLVPNDIYLGEDAKGHYPCTLLLTGPNMGGKSTLLRATCLAVIMAQLGCYVPCDVCVLSPADVIFTRLGAMDRIMSGESTFYVECSETATVLRHATQDSLVLLDELGRGTSTFDGYAIAYAVFRHLVETVCCRLLFATHYHPLTKEFASHPRVSLQHMACALNSDARGSFDNQKGLVFLYRLASGACPESYGLQVALMAGIPRSVVEAAARASRRMKLMISDNFRTSEGRSEFSTLHEEWLKTLLALSRISDSSLDEDSSDTLLCLWHEIKSFYGSKKH